MKLFKLVAFSCVFSFLLICFVNWSFDVSKWRIEDRGFFLAVVTLVFMIAAFMDSEHTEEVQRQHEEEEYQVEDYGD